MLLLEQYNNTFISHVLKEDQKILPRLGLVDLHTIDAPSFPRGLQFRLADGMAVNVLDQYRLGEGGTVMDTRASIGVATRSYFEVEGTVNLNCGMEII